ncbi:MAG: mevalonate kinase [Myxococcota bacterium]
MTADAAFGYAPGKVILLGEHAVVYGQPALAGTLDRGVRVAISRAGNADGPWLRGSGFGIDVVGVRPDPGGAGPESLRRALGTLVQLYGERVRELSIVVDGGIPAGSGLGSSAALSVAMIRGVHQFFGEELDVETVIRDAFTLEGVFHGTPSGVDHSVIARGGLLRFEKSSSGEVTLTELPLRRRLRLVVGLAGAHAGTAYAVAALRERSKRHPKAYERLFHSIGELVSEAQRCLADGHLAALGELMDLNQGYLNALGVSTPAIEALCAIARDRGALGAKLTGAGGGGAMIALVDEDADPVVKAFQAAGYNAFETELRASAISHES